MDFDAVLEKCGGFGRYQLIMLLLYGYINILASMHYFAQTIISFTPEHWCHHEALEKHSILEIRNFYAAAARPSCTSFDSIKNNSMESANTQSCNHWIYNYESGYESLSTELNWVCDKAYKSAVGQSMFFIGSVCGTFLFGFLADKFGRLPIVMLSSISGGLGDFLTSFITTLPAFAAARFIAGLSTNTMFYLMYIMVFEYLSPSHRTLGLNAIQLIFYTFGVFIAPWLAIWVGNWRHYLLITSLPTLGMFMYPVLICESAQWLITKKNISGAIKCLKHVAKVNRRKVDDKVFSKFVEYYQLQDSSEHKIFEVEETFVRMFRTPNLRKFIIISLLKAMIIAVSYDIMGRNMEGFGISPFKLSSYSSLGFVLAGLTIIWLQRYIGRKGMACGSMLVGSIICAITGVMIAYVDRTEYGMVLAVMAALSRYASIITYDAEVQFAAELIPASVRARGVANVHVVGHAFNFVSAYIIFLGTFFKPLPSIFISVLMLCGAVLNLTLPETMHRKLPETLTDGEEFGKHEKWWSFFCFHSKQTESTKL